MSNTTDANGNYQFCGLVPDDYYIVLDTDTLPDNYTVTGADSWKRRHSRIVI